MCTLSCCSKCCGVFSIFGIFFLVCIGSMFDSQPLFTDIEIWEEHESEDASKNCYIAAVIYAVTLALSIGCAAYDKVTRGRRPAIADTTVEPTPDVGLSQIGVSSHSTA